MATSIRSVWLRRRNISYPSADPPGKPWRFELTAVGLAAARETLVTATSHMAAMWTDLFESILSPGTELRWSGDGPGIGRDARIAYSSLLGRDMARAYLTECEGVRVLVPLDAAKRQLQGSPYIIEKDPPSRGFEADWIGLDNRGLVIVEAKGTYYGRPSEWLGPYYYPRNLMHTAIDQADRTTVFERRTRRKLPATRWAIASRWATEANGEEPSLLAWTRDDKILPDDDYRELSRILLRADTDRILTELGHGQVIDMFNTLALADRIPGELRVSVGVRDLGTGLAAAIGPFGVRPLRTVDDITRLERVRELNPDLVVVSLSRGYIVSSGRYAGRSVREEAEPGLTSERFARHSGLTAVWLAAGQEVIIAS